MVWFHVVRRRSRRLGIHLLVPVIGFVIVGYVLVNADIGGTGVAGPPPWLQDLLLGGLDRLARRVGLHRRLAAAVGRDPHRWDR